MSKVYVTRRFTFEASHHLPNYQGACARLHGHSYKLEVTVFGDVDEVTGMVMDFKVLKNMVNHIVISKVDHEDLNELYAMPTAENMVVEIFQHIDANLILNENCNARVASVKLWETEDSYAEYRGEC